MVREGYSIEIGLGFGFGFYCIVVGCLELFPMPVVGPAGSKPWVSPDQDEPAAVPAVELVIPLQPVLVHMGLDYLAGLEGT